MTENRLGFTTMTFKPALLAGEVSLSQLFEWGMKSGFGWVEVRDFNLHFTQDQLRQIKKDADRWNLRVHYAWDSTSVYNPEDCARFEQGICNAAFFGEGTCSRIVIAPELMAPDDGKVDYSAEESKVLISRLREIARFAADVGVIPVFENSGETVPGYDALLEAVPEMRMTLDTANSFNETNTGAPLRWPEFRDFIVRRCGQIPYVHLKSSLNGKTCFDLLETGDMPLGELFLILNEEAWFCVELPSNESLESCFRRLEAGAELVRRFIV